MSSIYPNDRDYFFDHDGNIYQVIGYAHPKNSIYCLQKYSVLNNLDEMDKDYFKWYSNITKKNYLRNISTYSSKSATFNIKNNKYRKISSLYGVEFIQYPKSEIETYLNPIYKLNKLRNQVRTSFLSMTDQERYAIEISYIIEQEIGIDNKSMGITGSILWEGVHSLSDIDLVIYGIKNTKRFLKGIGKLFHASDKFRSPSLTDRFNWAGKFSQKSGMSIDDCTVSIMNKKFLLFYSKYYLSIAFNPNDEEILKNSMGKFDTKFINVENKTNIILHATVINDDWMYFYPGIIYLGDVEVKLEEKTHYKIPNIIRAVVFEHENIGYYNKGTRVEIRGLLQKIKNPSEEIINNVSLLDSNDSEFAQIIVGTSENYGKEYIKNLEI